MISFGSFLGDTWATPGVSEFLSVLLGGGITLLAQRWALRHDREKEATRRRDEEKGLAWSIYFKISDAYETLASVSENVREGRARASANDCELWQVLQTPAHDPSPGGWTVQELVFLVDQKQLDLMERYRIALLWQSNIIQSTRLLRDLRVEFLSRTPADVQGTSGSISLDDTNRRELLPRIAHLRSLSESIESVVLAQEPQARQLLEGYASAMKSMIGMKPDIEFESGEGTPTGSEAE